MMSYASSSTSTRLSQGYDVFLCFRGVDTRNGFCGHLYKDLIRKRIKTFIDDESLDTGGFIAPELLEAIKASRFAIVIISSNFATSKWCLEEITKVVDYMEQGKLIVIPVFYHVSPSDVRHQSNCFKQGFANHEADPEITPQKVAWKSALKTVGNIKGWHVTPDRNESDIITEISRRILKEMQDASPVNLTKGLVGIESRVNEVIKILNIESSDVRYIGICGMSGIGKTTLAEVVFEGIRNKFQESSFIGNIKDVSKEHGSDLCKLQQKILDDVLKEESIPVRSVKHAQTLLMTKLRDLKVIIVLDDVNQEYPHKEVLGRLEVCYLRLDRYQQHTFMCIACFLKGRDIDLVKDILTDIGLYPECGITDLINKFLITINIVDCVWMHDLLQQMCWEILRKESQQYNGN